MKQTFTQHVPSLFSRFFISLLFLLVSVVALAQTPVDIAKNYVNQNTDKHKLLGTDVSEMKVSSAYLSPTTGWYHVYFNQTYQSVEVYNALMSVTLQNNQVQYLTHSFVKDLGNKVSKNALKSEKITPLKAIQNAAISVNLAASTNLKEVIKNSLDNKEDVNPNKKTFSDNSLSNENIEVSLYWFLQEFKDGEKITSPNILLVWNVRFLTKDGSKGWNVQVDAFSGQVLKTLDDIVHCDFGIPQSASIPHNCAEHTNTSITSLGSPIKVVAPNNYNVFDYPLESPNHGVRSIVASPYARFAPAGTGPGTTNGWHEDGTNTYTNTKGNYVDAKDDIAADNEGSIGSSPSSATLDFNYPYTFGTGTASGNLNAAVTNLFYWNNVIHDVLWRYGFDEPSGNFQKNNMGRGGIGNDFVYADAQDGSGTSNANFQTPTDGGNGRMQMYIWGNGGTPAYTPDSDFDNGIIAHEYGHGWSIRLTGGPANSSCLQNGEQGGEGWSDYAALMFTTNWAALTPSIASANLAKGIGTYAITQPTTGSGIRPYKYSYDMVNINGPVTYGKVGDSNFSQPHGIGSIWATMLWDMTWEIILADNQIVNNIYDTPANVADMRGNVAALKLVNEGLRLQPCSPSFVDARNAILQADQMLFGGRYRCAIGRAFSRRGLGANASTGASSNDRIVTEDFTPISGPAITSPLSNIVCSNETFNYIATTSSGSVSSFTWTRSSVAGISNPSASGNTATVNETLINTTNTPITVTYSFILSPDPCGGTASPQPVRVVVNPRVIPTIGVYNINQNATVPSGEGLAVGQASTNTVDGTLTTSSPTYVRSNSGTVYSASVTTYYQTYTFVAPITGTMTFRTTAANLLGCGTDTHMSIYQNSFSPTSPATNFLEADDDSGGGNLSLITRNVTQGTTYIIVVGAFCGLNTGTFTLQATSAIFNGGTNNWYLSPTGGTPLASGNVFNPVGLAGSGIANTSTPGSYNFYVSNANYASCRTQTTFTIVPVASVGGTLSNASVCSVSSSGVVTLTGAIGNIIRWEISTDNFATHVDDYNFTGNTYPYTNLTQTTQYRVVVQYPNLPPTISSVGIVTVGNITVAGSVTPDATVCLGVNSGTLSLAGHSGDVLNWESSTDNFVTTTIIANTSNTQTYTNLTQETKYRVVVKNGTCVASNSNPSTLSMIPVTVGGSVSSNATVCSGTNTGTLALSGSLGNVLRWESSNDNFVTKTNIVNATFSQAYSNLTQTIQYRAVLQNGGCAIVNSSPATITVDSLSLGGTVNTSTSVCGNGNTGILNLTGRRGTILRWESSTDNFATNTSITNTTASQAFLNLVQSTRYRSVVKNGVCPATNANPALITVIAMPIMVAPTVTQPTCFAAGTIVINNTASPTVNQTINGSIDATDPTQIGRISRDAVPSVCGTIKAFTVLNDSSPRNYDSYTVTNSSLTSQCITATLTGTNSSNMFLTVYSGTFIPANITANFFGDAGASDPTMIASVTVAAGATIVMVVHNIDAGVPSGAYSLAINGGNLSAPTEYSTNNGTTWQATNSFGSLIGGNYNLKARTVGGGNCIVSYANNPVIISIPNGSVGGVINKDSTVCSGVNTGILNLSGHTGDILRWESSKDNFATTTNISNVTPNYTFSNLSELTKYRAVVKNGACAETNATAATIAVLNPATPSVSDASVSNGNSISLNGIGCSGGNTILKWFKTSDNTPVTMPITPTANGRYYAKCQLTSGSTVCSSVNSNDALVLVIPKDLIYVNFNNTGEIQDGASWATSMNNLKTALSFSENGTSIWLKEGTYKPTGSTDRNVSFNVTSGVKLYGGFTGTETTLQERGSNAETILSGDIGVENDATDNSYHILTILDATVSPIIDKISIKNGYASNQPLSFTSDASKEVKTTTSQLGGTSIYTERGGGIYIKNSSPLITNCKIQNNGATSGGGIYVEGNSIPIIKFSTISGNTATLGGGFYNQSSNTVIDNSLITGNKSFGGAAIYNNRSNPNITNVTISGNDCIVGTIFNSSGSGSVSNPVIKNSILWNNTGTTNNLSVITYSLVEGGYAGTGNLNLDPKFVSGQSPSLAPTIAGNYHILYESPCIDAGENGSISLTDLDLDGKLRRYDAAIVDMGAYELIGNFDTANSGSWNINTTWKCNCIPDGSLPVRIMGDHEVSIPDGLTGQAKSLKFVGNGKLMQQGTGGINIIR